MPSPLSNSSASPKGAAAGVSIRVLLVDDHPITRQGVKALIEAQTEFIVCGEADTAAAALALSEAARPNITVVDISLRGTDGIELVKELKAKSPSVPVIVLSMHDQQFYAERAARAGAAGYVMKEHASDLILKALRAVAAGQTFFDAQTHARLKPQTKEKKAFMHGVDQLSERELQVLRLLGEGYATREVAEQLAISSKTVDTYRDHLKRKLDLSTGELLVQFAIKWSASAEGRGAERPAQRPAS